MGVPYTLNQFLPSKFAGVLPLYIGVELILGLAILNKVSGIYGILSIFTGHPINFWQWLYNFLAILALPFYVSGFKGINKANVGKFSLICLIYTADTFTGILYTLYFIFLWFSNEDPDAALLARSDEYIETAKNVVREISNSDAAKEAIAAASINALASQSATPTYELIVTLFSTAALTGVRLYFTLVIISFTRTLIKQEVNNGASSFAVPTTFFSRSICRFEERAKDYLKSSFR